MISMRNSLILITLVSLLSACGPRITEKSTQAQGQVSGTAFDAESFYYQLPQPDLSVGTGFGAVVIEQRESSTHFCRRSRSVNTSTYQYLCYQLFNSGAAAQSTYTSLQSALGAYPVTIGNYIGGASIMEITNGQMYGGGSILCQKLTPQNPTASTTYRCFQKL